MKIKSRSAQEIAEALIGTSHSLEDIVTDDEFENRELLEEVDSIAAQCGTCDWWVESEEINEDGDCGDCCQSFHIHGV